jgi:hypothetical protein
MSGRVRNSPAATVAPQGLVGPWVGAGVGFGVTGGVVGFLVGAGVEGEDLYKK